MSRRPRNYAPGLCQKTTRRTSEGRCFLNPQPGLRELVGYLLAYAANTNQVEILAATVMGNHHHLDSHDVDGNHGTFLSCFHGLLARAVNNMLDRVDHLWDASEPAVQELVGLVSQLEDFVYIAANPVAAGLVPTPEDWTGFIITPDMIGKKFVFERPDTPFFRTEEGKAMPETQVLEVHEPPGAEAKYGPGGYAKEAAKLLAQSVRALQVERQKIADRENAQRAKERRRRRAARRKRRARDAHHSHPKGTARESRGMRSVRALQVEKQKRVDKENPQRGRLRAPRRKRSARDADHSKTKGMATAFRGIEAVHEMDKFTPIPRPKTTRLQPVICSVKDVKRTRLAELRLFRTLYDEAVTKRIAGGNPLFPYGTYARRRWGGVRVAPGPTPSNRSGITSNPCDRAPPPPRAAV